MMTRNQKVFLIAMGAVYVHSCSRMISIRKKFKKAEGQVERLVTIVVNDEFEKIIRFNDM
jgi:hypothetical protein